MGTLHVTMGENCLVIKPEMRRNKNKESLLSLVAPVYGSGVKKPGAFLEFSSSFIALPDFFYGVLVLVNTSG